MIALTQSTFESFITSHQFALVHFWAAWNGHDIAMRRFLEDDLPAEWRGMIAMGMMDVDQPEHFEICVSHKIMNIPFLAFYRNGLLFTTLTGLNTTKAMEYLRQMIG